MGGFLFERTHHQAVATVLQCLDPQVLAAHHCYFGGGTAMALRYGEYRESIDIDFLVADLKGYRELRRVLGGVNGLDPLLRAGMQLALAREVSANQYGIRTMIKSGDASIKFEIVHEARIDLDAPAAEDAICGVPTLTAIDLAAEKLLANADRWGDTSTFSRDLVDLAMQDLDPVRLAAAHAKADAAYGAAISDCVQKAVANMQANPGWLLSCMKALSITGVSPAQLMQRFVNLARRVQAHRLPPQ